MKTCSKCFAEIDDSAKFCPHCGSAVTGDPKTDTTFTAEGPSSSTSGYSSSAATPQKTNGFAVAGFVVSFFVSILGIIFSAIALKQISDNDEGGKGLAIAGLVLGIVGVFGWIILLTTGACALSTLRFFYY